MPVHHTVFRLFLVFATLTASGSALAEESANDALQDLQHKWATANYAADEKEREDALKMLARSADAAVTEHPQSAQLLAWRGIILSTYAGAKGGLGAIDIAEAARDSLLAAAQIDETAIGGGIDTSLGVLYYKVPGWPLGFGDDDVAARYLARGLAVNPDGVDENYFMADFLFEQGNKQGARDYLQKALAAAPRPGREDADEGRGREIEVLLSKLEQ